MRRSAMVLASSRDVISVPGWVWCRSKSRPGIGTSVHLKAGDVLVQRGTIHNWVNNGTVPCVIAFAMIAAKSVTVGGNTNPLSA